MAKFVQIIEYTTTKEKRAEMDKLTDEWLAATEGRRTAGRAVSTSDRDNPNTYVDIIEFPSYEEAMKNNDLPETAEFAKKAGELSDGPPTFRNLDVMRIDED
jgi:quinol monooxygenase YgiN